MQGRNREADLENRLVDTAGKGEDGTNWESSTDTSEKAMAPHSSTLAWKTPWMEEPGRLQSMGSQRVGHD